MNTDTQHIMLDIVGYTIHLNVKREEEPIYRDAAKWVNAIYEEYYATYKQMKPEKLWAYTALRIACSLQRESRLQSVAPIQEKLHEINEELAKVLKEDNNNE